MYQEFAIDQAEMAQALSVVSHAISSHPLKPIYSGVMVQARTGGLILTATDGEMTVRTTADANISVEGVTVFPARLLSELVRRQNSGEIKFSVDDKNTARIAIAGSKSSMVCMNGDDFLKLPVINNGVTVSLPASDLKNAISRVMFAVSNDESRKVLTGVLTEFYPNCARLVSIDGFRLAMMTIDADNQIPDGNDCVSIVIPGRVLNELSKLLPDDDTKVSFTFDGAHCLITVNDTNIYTSLLIGEFIDYHKIIPDGAQTEAIVERQPLMDALERCNLMAREGKSNLITIEINETGLHMNARAERGNVHEELPIQMTGNDAKISFNSQYLIDAVKNVGTDEMRMMLNGSVAPCLIRPKDGEQFTFLVLPVRTND